MVELLESEQLAKGNTHFKSIAAFIVCEAVDACNDFKDLNQAYSELVNAYKGKPSSLSEDTVNRLLIQRELLGEQTDIGLLAIEAGVFGAIQTIPANKLDLEALAKARDEKNHQVIVQIALTPKVFLRRMGIDGKPIALNEAIDILTAR